MQTNTFFNLITLLRYIVLQSCKTEFPKLRQKINMKNLGETILFNLLSYYCSYNHVLICNWITRQGGEIT